MSKTVVWLRCSKRGSVKRNGQNTCPTVCPISHVRGWVAVVRVGESFRDTAHFFALCMAGVSQKNG